MLRQIKSFINPFDDRYEDLARGNVALNVLRDLMAGLIVHRSPAETTTSVEARRSRSILWFKKARR